MFSEFCEVLVFTFYFWEKQSDLNLTLKNKFTPDEIKYLEEEFENLAEISLPKLSHLVQQEFYRALKTLHIHELQVWFLLSFALGKINFQDFNIKAAIEFARDLLCIDEVDFDNWLRQRHEDATELESKYYRVTARGDVRETNSHKIFNTQSSSTPIMISS